MTPHTKSATAGSSIRSANSGSCPGVSLADLPTFDAVVIGAGAGGCAAAHRLATAGLSVVLLEEGPAEPDARRGQDAEGVPGRPVPWDPPLAWYLERCQHSGLLATFGRPVMPLSIGRCCFGCPTGAKGRADRVFLPEALTRGLVLLSGARARRVLFDAGARVRGVEVIVQSGPDGTKAARHAVRARVVVLAAGTIGTPLLLRQSGIRAPALGRGLTLHPAARVVARFDGPLVRGVPQGLGFRTSSVPGAAFEGISVPPDLQPFSFGLSDRRLLALLAEPERLASFGLLVEDTGRGTVRRTPLGVPFVRYDLERRDGLRLLAGIALLARAFLVAGAREVYLPVRGNPAATRAEDLPALLGRVHPVRDLEVMGFHPLGTARLGSDPRTSVLDTDGAVRGVQGLYVADGSAVPGPLGVNPQVTIMALALRTAQGIPQ